VAILPLIEHKWLRWPRDDHHTERRNTLRFRDSLWLSLFVTQHRQKPL